MKSIFLTCPAFSRNGGIRVILEWANRLSYFYHVNLRILNADEKPDWFSLRQCVRIVRDDTTAFHADFLIITSPHSIRYEDFYTKAKKVIFLQMLEHLFRPREMAWQLMCRKTYLSRLPMICISHWNMETLAKEFGRKGKMFLVGNGVNLMDFPIEHAVKDNKSVLVEGWVAHNATKDKDHVGPRVAHRLKEEFGVRVLTYSAHPPRHSPMNGFDEYFVGPDICQLNELYTRATIMLKATRYDARACAPLEAWTKGTVTARAVVKGDDDLVHEVNCLRCPYNEEALYFSAKRLLTDNNLRLRLADNGLKQIQALSWDYWMKKIMSILETL